MKRNRLLIMISVIVMASLLLACTAPAVPEGQGAAGQAAGGQAAGSAGSAAAPAGKTKVTWLMLSDWTGEDAAKQFMADNPDIDLVVEKVAFNDLFQQIQIRLSSGSETPDVLSVDVPLVTGYGVRNWLAPLDDIYSPEEKADLLPAAWEAGSYQGKLIAAPVSTSTQLLFVNDDLLKKADIPIPGPDDRLTYEQLADMAKKLTQSSGGVTDVYGLAWEQSNRIYQLQPMEESLGGKAIGDDGLTVQGVINSKPWVDAYTYYSKAFNEWKVAPPVDVSVQDLFAQGKLAMMIAGPWQIKRLSLMNDGKGPGFNWSVSRHPYFENGKIVTPTGSWHIGINAKSKNIDAAKRVVKYFTTKKGAEVWWRKASGDFPAQKSVLALFQTDPQFQEGTWTYMKTAANEATVNPVPRPKTPGYLEYEQILQNTFSDISKGADVQQALDTAAQRIQRELDKYR